MPFKKKKPNNDKNEGVIKSVFIAYSIILFHFLLLAALGLLVLFFRGVINYMAWIFLGGAAAIIISGYIFLRKIRKEHTTIKEILSLPEFSGKDIEIKLLGGAASFKVGKNQESDASAPDKSYTQYNQLESPVKSRIENLGELSRLYENNMITDEEYEDLKKELLKSVSKHDNTSGQRVLEINSEKKQSGKSTQKNGENNE
ncbi:MAG: SHOCT domain-containing protein [Thermodesulfobacteriota bacterium]